jgi:hypothetical protein
MCYHIGLTNNMWAIIRENCQFIRTTKDGLDTTSVDMRYPSYCKLVLSRKRLKF